MTQKEKEQLKTLVSISKDLILAVVGNGLMNNPSERQLIAKLEELNKLEEQTEAKRLLTLELTLEELSQLESTLRLAIEDELENEVRDGVWLRIAESTHEKIHDLETKTRKHRGGLK